jgi:hypothetical protein
MSNEVTDIEIRGGIGPYEAAAIAAVIDASLAAEARARSRRPADRRPPAWVRLGMPAPFGDFDPPVIADPGRNWPDA